MELQYATTIGGAPKTVSEPGGGTGTKVKAVPVADAVTAKRRMDTGSEIVELPLARVVIREDLYPRDKIDAATVRRYAENLDVLPPIEVNQHNVIIDGVHRFEAYRDKARESVPAIVTETANDAELDRLSVIRNARHGLQLSAGEKRNKGIAWYEATAEAQRTRRLKQQFADDLSVTVRTFNSWIADIDQSAREELDRRIGRLWMSCHTQQEVADAVSAPRRTVADAVAKFGDLGNLSQSAKIAADFADFEPELYNVWTRPKEAAGRTDHSGDSERIVEHLLYAYTDLFDVVVDPFAGGGATIDVCAQRARRCYVSDIKPSGERESEIRQHDITTGMPRVPRWQDVALVYLDPPRWKAAKGRNGDEPQNHLANMELDDFHDALYGVISGFAAKLRSGARIALLIQPTQWDAPEHRFTDHAVEMLRRVKLPVVQRYQCPYPAPPADAQMAQWAKESRSSLALSRELVIWEKE